MIDFIFPKKMWLIKRGWVGRKGGCKEVSEIYKNLHFIILEWIGITPTPCN